MSASQYARPKLQFKAPPGFSNNATHLLHDHHTILFYSRDADGELTESSRKALALVQVLGIDCRVADAVVGSAVELSLQNYSGWQYFPQLYVFGEFIGGNLVIEEFFSSGEYNRILRGRNSSAPTVRPLEHKRNLKSRSIWRLSLSPQEEELAVARADGSLEVVRTSDRTVRTLRSHYGWVNTVRFDASGRRLFSAGTDTQIRVWGLRNGDLVLSLPGHSRWVNDIAVAPSGRYFASVGADRVVRLWEAQSLRLASEKANHPANIWCALALEDMLVIGDEDGVLHVTSMAECFEKRGQVRGHQNVVTAISQSLCPSEFCTTGLDGMVCGWKGANGPPKKLFEYAGHSERVWCVCPVADRSALASGGADGSVHLWQPGKGNRLDVFEYSAQPLALCYIPRETLLVVGLADGTLVWQRL